MREAMVSDQSQDEAEQQPKIGRIPALIAAVAVVGIAIGAAAGLLTLMLYQVERFALGYIENAHESGPFNMPAIRRAISVTVGASIAAVIWWLLRTRTTTVPSVKKAVGGALMPVWQTIVHVLLQIFIVGTGMSIGREVAPRELGAMFGQRFARWVRLDAKDTRMLVAITAAAGLAGSLQRAACRHVLRGGDPARRRDTRDGHARVRMLGARLMGGEPGQGHAHVLFDWRGGRPVYPRLHGVRTGCRTDAWRRRRCSAAAPSGRRKTKPSGAGILWMMPLAGLLTGVVAIVVPQVMGNGRATRS